MDSTMFHVQLCRLDRAPDRDVRHCRRKTDSAAMAPEVVRSHVPRPGGTFEAGA